MYNLQFVIQVYSMTKIVSVTQY